MSDKGADNMPEKVGWWTVGSVIISAMFGLSLYGFAFLNDRITEGEKEQRTCIKELRFEFAAGMDKLDRKMDVLLRRP